MTNGHEIYLKPVFFGVEVYMKKTLIGLTLLAVVATTLGACGGDAPPSGGASPAASPAASPSPKKS